MHDVAVSGGFNFASFTISSVGGSIGVGSSSKLNCRISTKPGPPASTTLLLIQKIATTTVKIIFSDLTATASNFYFLFIFEVNHHKTDIWEVHVRQLDKVKMEGRYIPQILVTGV